MNHSNRALAIRWFEEVWNQKRVDTIHELLAADAPGHMEGQEVQGPRDFLPVHQQMLQAMPDLEVEIEDVLADGDDAVVRWTIRALNGRMTFSGMTWFKFRDGQIVEGWDRWNHSAFVQRLQLLLAEQ
jgi:predicted SnoaL-like aldol condensation-catalyzing enzyme